MGFAMASFFLAWSVHPSHFQLPCMFAWLQHFLKKHRTCYILTLFFGKICQTRGTNCWSENLLWKQFQNTNFLFEHNFPFEHTFLIEDNFLFWRQFLNTNFSLNTIPEHDFFFEDNFLLWRQFHNTSFSLNTIS